MSKTDSQNILRLLPLVSGGLGATLFLLNRFFTANLTASQARSDVLGVILSAVLILVGLLWQSFQVRSPDAVVLEGEEKFDLAADLSDTVKTELAWASHLLLTNTVTKSLVIWYDGKVLLRRGILPDSSEIKRGAIFNRVLEKGKPVYLVDLKVYPGRVEFDYLPPNTQGIICQPLAEKGVMILGANIPRSYTKQDEVWIAGIGDKLGEILSREV